MEITYGGITLTPISGGLWDRMRGGERCSRGRWRRGVGTQGPVRGGRGRIDDEE